MKLRIVTIPFASLAFIGGSLVAQDPPETTSRFFNASPEKMRRLVETTTAEEREAAIQDMKRMLAQPEYGKAGLLRALAYLGDEEAIQQLVQEFLRNDAQSSGSLAAMQNPRIIEMVAPEFYREEPETSGYGDILIVPRSYRSADLAVKLLAQTPVFSQATRDWAESLRGLTFGETRALVRPWWRANEQFFREKNYQAVQPGPPRPRDPYATSQTTAVPAPPSAVPATPSADAAPSSPTPSAAEKPVSPSQIPWLGFVIAGALVLLLAVALYLSTRRRGA